MPIVLLGEKIHHSPFVTVAIDNVAAAREATEYLLASGRRRIAVIGADLEAPQGGPAQSRLEGYQQAYAAHGSAVDDQLLRTTTGWFRSSGYGAVAELVDEHIAFDALLCLNDVLAFGAVRALCDRGVTVPGDVAVVGWDDVEEASYSTPSLSSVSPDKEGIAEAAVTALLAQIDGAPAPAEDLLCTHTLQLRESTGAAH